MAMSALMLGMGLFQGPMAPVNSQLARDWMPRGGGSGGVERAWAQRFTSLSHNASPLLAALITPRIAQRYGWRTVCYVYAAVGGAFLGVPSPPEPAHRDASAIWSAGVPI
jgi:MFS family permease